MCKRIKLSLDQFKIDENLLKSELYCYDSTIMFLDNKIDLNIFLKDGDLDKLENHIEKIENQVNWVQSNNDFIENQISQSYLVEIKNDYWLDEGESEVSPNQFVKTIMLLALSIDIKNNKVVCTNLEYDDGDMFLGHRVSVDIVDGKVTRISI